MSPWASGLILVALCVFLWWSSEGRRSRPAVWYRYYRLARWRHVYGFKGALGTCQQYLALDRKHRRDLRVVQRLNKSRLL